MSCCIARSNTLRFKIRNFTLRLFAAQRVPLDAGDRIRHARLLYVARPGASLLGAGKADSGSLHARGARTDRGRPDTQGRRFEWGAARRDVCAAAVKDVRAECSRPCTHALAFHICVMATVLCLSHAPPISCVQSFHGPRCKHLRALCSFLAFRTPHGES